ncbi:hypothetical protein [Microbispora sp. H10885]|uniref:phage terminase small subunit n=1 Tax=Microbispora sp. H10885 TaxID=2729110 RepID=UPI0016002563|nr:hypothetical protein [Microbispora sp. H10885]
MVEAYFRRPGHNALAEIRQNESLLGATVTDRMRLRMNKTDNSQKSPDKPDSLPENVADMSCTGSSGVPDQGRGRRSSILALCSFSAFSADVSASTCLL